MVSKNILKFSLRQMLGQQQRETLFLLLDALSEVLSECHSPESLRELQAKVDLALAMMERISLLLSRFVAPHYRNSIIAPVS